MTLRFEGFLKRLCDPSARLLLAEMRGLSLLTSDQAKSLVGEWLKIPLPKRRKLVPALIELAEENVELDYVAVFKIALEDPDDLIRRQAAEGLWEDEELSTAKILARVLQTDPAPAVRAAAATALSHFLLMMELEDLEEVDGRPIAEALYRVIDDAAEPLEVRRRAVEAVGYLSEERARAIIGRAYSDASQKMRVSAIFAMGRNADRRWLPAVLAELQNENAEMRFEAARASGELEDERAVPTLVKLVGDRDREVRIAAVDALGKIGGNGAKHALERLSNSANKELSTAAEEALEEMRIFEEPLSFQETDGD